MIMEIIQFIFILGVGVDSGVDLLVGEGKGVVLGKGYVFFDGDVGEGIIVLLFFH